MERTGVANFRQKKAPRTFRYAKPYDFYLFRGELKVPLEMISVGWNQVATIPEGFAPSGAINFVLLNNNSTSESTNTPVFGRIGTNGVINVYSFTEKSCAPTGIVTYII